MDTLEAAAIPPSPEPAQEQYKSNIRCLFLVVFFHISCSAIALGPIFDAYLLNLGGNHGNALVGAVESTRGLLQLLLAYPIGALSDRFSRVRVLRFNLPFFTISLCIVVVGVLIDNLFLIFAGIALWAPCSQCCTSSMQVMLADSASPSRRTKLLANMTTTRLLSNALGPFLQIALLLILGKNHWHNSVLRCIIAMGCFLWPGVLKFTCSIQDLPALEKLTNKGRSVSSIFDEEALELRLVGIKIRWWLAVTIELASFVTSIGAGMTVKFFPLFFKGDYKFSPIALCILSALYPLCVSVMVQACQRIAKRLGRLQAACLFHAMGTLFLWAMVYCRSLYLVLPLYILRGSIMNAKGPITRAIIMDLVSTEMRARWNSIQSISSFSWAGSAALGGYIADSSGDYRFTFAVTATIYSISGLMFMMLLFIYPREGVNNRQVTSDRQAASLSLIEQLPTTQPPSDSESPTPQSPNNANRDARQGLA